jgi:cytochrome c peroxidase
MARPFAIHCLCATTLLLLGGACQPSAPPVSHFPPDELWEGKIVLGSPSLTAGIPGQGPLTTAEIQQWLANPANHEPLAVTLPLGLRSNEPPHIPAENPLTRAKIELGRQLFFDLRLSKNGMMSCVTCHSPRKRFTSDQLAHPRLRETAVAINRILGREQFWDGRAKSLEDQVHFTVEHPDELNTTQAECVAQIAAIPGYRMQFERIFGKLDFEAISQAIASFVRTIVTQPSAWDYDVELRRLEALPPEELTAEVLQYREQISRAAAERPLSEAARRGSQLFFSDRLGCSRCHSGPNFTDERYYDIGLRPQPLTSFTVRKDAEDFGRYHVTKQEADRYTFKTPTLRNVQLTPPYMHDGRFHTLGAVLQYFARGGDVPNDQLKPFELSAEEAADLLEFLHALSSPLPRVEMERLPE